MSEPMPHDSALAALNDKELEVLRLLTLGHTVKSIATQQGRSEASINERLRDARRKTGIGSSRELARLVDGQKIWNKNIDLSKPCSLSEAGVPPASSGRIWSKGTLIMLIAMPAAAVGLAIMAAQPMQGPVAPQTAHAAPVRQSPLVGTWSLDVNRIPAAERPRRVTIGFRVSNDQKWSSTVEIVAPDGSTTRAESTAATDGVPVPISGNMDFIDTASLRQPAPGTLVMTLGKNGAPVSTRVYTVAKDRKSMTETIVWAGTSIPKLETTWFNRID